MRHPLEPALKEGGDRRFADPAQGQAAEGHAQLYSGQEILHVFLQAADRPCSGAPQGNQPLDAGLTHAHQGEFGRHKETVRQDEQGDGNHPKKHQFNHFARERLLRHDTGVACAKGGGTFLGRFTYQMTSDIRCGGIVAAQRKSKRIWVWGGVLAVVAAAGLVFLGMHRGGPHFEPSRLDKVTRGEIDQSVVATGKVQPITKIELKSKASGIVQNLYVDINQLVHKGQLLAQLDRQEIMAEVDAQRATLQAAEANVKSASASIEHDKVDAAAPDLPMYYATLQRNKEMIKEGIVSQQGMDNANRDYLSALNKKNVAVAQIDVDRAKLHQAEAQVAQNQASLKSLEEQLSYTTLTAPIDGEVLSRDVEVGNAVSSILVL